MKSPFAILLALGLLTLCVAQPKPKSALNKAALETYLRHVELFRRCGHVQD